MEDLTEHLIRKITTKSKHNRNEDFNVLVDGEFNRHLIRKITTKTKHYWNKDFNVLVDGGFNRTPYQENYFQN